MLNATQEQESRGLRARSGGTPCPYLFAGLGTTAYPEVAWRKKASSWWELQMAGHPRTEEFFKETVEPTVDEYLARHENVRRGRLAAIVLNHMVDYWHEDTQESLTAIRAALLADTPIPRYPGYSSSDIIWDLADASKHAKLNRADSRLTNADQVKPHYIGGLTAAPLTAVALTGLVSGGVGVTLNDGQVFSLVYGMRQATKAWREKLGLA